MSGKFPSSEEVAKLRQTYPPGTRIELIEMPDAPETLPMLPGSVGTVRCVDDASQLLMQWDSGRSLAIVPGVDSFKILSKPV